MTLNRYQGLPWETVLLHPALKGHRGYRTVRSHDFLRPFQGGVAYET
jgi:hypothetical protein